LDCQEYGDKSETTVDGNIRICKLCDENKERDGRKWCQEGQNDAGR
jgi:hypothetical protein